MLRSTLFLSLFALAACKKEAEPEAAAETKEVVDAASTVTVHLGDAEVEKVKLVCKEKGHQADFVVDGNPVVITGVTGPQCSLTFQPQGAKATGIKGGTTLDCRFDGGDVACKAR